MPVTTGPRTGVTLWSDPADPVLRSQFTSSHQAVEDLMAIDVQQTLPLPAAGTRGRYLWATDDRGGRLWRDNGAAFVDLGPKPIDGPLVGSYTAKVEAHALANLSDPVLTVRGKTGQTGDPLRVTDPTGATIFAKVTSGGILDASQGITADQVTDRQAGLHSIDLRTGGALLTVGASAAAGWTVSSTPVGVVPFRVNGPTGLTADLAQWQIAGTTKANMTAGGRLNLTGGLTVTGSPNGYTDEIQFGSTAAASGGAGPGLVSYATGTPRMYFDHRGTTSLGDWYWRNWSPAAGTTRMSLSAAGVLQLPSGSNPSLILGPSTIPAVDFQATSGPRTWRLAAGYNDANSMSLVDVTGGAAQVVILSNAGNMFLQGSDSIVRLRNAQSYDPVRLEASNARLWTQGDVSGMGGANTAGSARFLFGLRSDVAGNADDVIIYGYAGAFRVFPNATERFKVSTTGATVIGGDLRTTGVGGIPRLYIKATDAAADNKVWDMVPIGANLAFRAINDAENSTTTWLNVIRSGMGIVAADFAPLLRTNGFNVPVVRGVGGTESGTAPSSTSMPMQQYGSQSITTDASGMVTITLPAAFPNALVSYQGTSGDLVLGAGVLITGRSIGSSTSGIQFFCQSLGSNGATLANTTFRLNWVAYGW